MPSLRKLEKDGMFPVLVIQGNDPTELAIARAFKDYNIPVYIYNKGKKRTLSSYSKYIFGTIYGPDPIINEKKFVLYLENLGKEFLEKYKQRILLFPTDDGVLFLLSKNYSLFKKYFVILGDLKEENLLKHSQKDYLFQTLMNKGYEEFIPLTFACHNKNDLEKIKIKITFPCIIKPSEKDISLSFYNQFKTKILVVKNKQKLEAKLRYLLSKNYKLLVQEMVNSEEGKEACWWGYRNKKGDIFGITIREVRKFPTIGGTATFEVFENIPIIHQYVKDILKVIDFWGMCEISFMEDIDDKKYKLLEINPRCWFQILLAIELGFNFPYIAYKEVYDNIYIKPEIRESNKKKWVNIEYDFIKSVIMKKDVNLLKRIWLWIFEVFIGCVHGIYSLSDPKVSIIRLLCLLKSLFKNLPKIKKIIKEKKYGINNYSKAR